MALDQSARLKDSLSYCKKLNVYYTRPKIKQSTSGYKLNVYNITGFKCEDHHS